MADNFNFVQAQKFRLAGSGVTSSATSIILQSFKLPDGSTTITLSNFGDIGFMTLEPGTSREEQISFTGVTQNADGTATLTGVTRGLRFVSPYDEVSANKKSHAGGSIAVISNTAAFYNELGAKDNDETISGLYTFTQFPQKSGSTTPTAAAELASKAYVDSVVAGSANYDQNVVSGVAGETLAAGNLVYFKTSDGRWWLTDADTASTVDGVILGFAQGAATAGNAVNIVIGGIDKNQSGLTAGTTYYASNTGGALSSSAGTTERVVGKALTTTQIILNPQFAVIPTAKEKVALTNITANTDWYGASSAGSDTYAITVTPALSAYANGQRFRFKADVANTGAATLNVNGLGAITIKKLHDQDLITGDIEANQIVEVVYNSTGPVFEMISQTSTSLSAEIQKFTGNGTWTKPSGAKIVDVYMWGGGGGGGSGARSAGNSSNRDGGSGGGGGSFGYKRFLADSLSSTETVVVGAAANGGAAVSSDATGNAGTAGNFSSFGTTVVLKAPGGGAGAGGLQSGAAAGGTSSAGNGDISQAGGTGGAGGDDSTGAQGIDTATNVSARGGGGGGGAGGANSAGGAGGAFITNYVKAGGVGSSGASGTTPSDTDDDLLYGGTGGAGGGGVNSGTGGTGGNGGFPGGGGGGGGGSNSTSGAGGNGAAGQVIVISYF